MQIISLIGVEGLYKRVYTDLELHKWTTHSELRLRNIFDLLSPWLWFRFLFEIQMFAKIFQVLPWHLCVLAWFLLDSLRQNPSQFLLFRKLCAIAILISLNWYFFTFSCTILVFLGSPTVSVCIWWKFMKSWLDFSELWFLEENIVFLLWHRSYKNIFWK